MDSASSEQGKSARRNAHQKGMVHSTRSESVGTTFDFACPVRLLTDLCTGAWLRRIDSQIPRLKARLARCSRRIPSNSRKFPHCCATSELSQLLSQRIEINEGRAFVRWSGVATSTSARSLSRLIEAKWVSFFWSHSLCLVCFPQLSSYGAEGDGSSSNGDSQNDVKLTCPSPLSPT